MLSKFAEIFMNLPKNIPIHICNMYVCKRIFLYIYGIFELYMHIYIYVCMYNICIKKFWGWNFVPVCPGDLGIWKTGLRISFSPHKL